MVRRIKSNVCHSPTLAKIESSDPRPTGATMRSLQSELKTEFDHHHIHIYIYVCVYIYISNVGVLIFF